MFELEALTCEFDHIDDPLEIIAKQGHVSKPIDPQADHYMPCSSSCPSAGRLETPCLPPVYSAAAAYHMK